MKFTARLLIAATLLFGSGCATKQDWIDRTLVTEDVTGTWYGTVGSPSGGFAGSFELWLDLEQNGQKVKGSVRFTPSQTMNNNGPINGTVPGNLFQFAGERGQVTGEMTIRGDEMNGAMTAMFGNRPASLRRVDPSSSPASPPR